MAAITDKFNKVSDGTGVYPSVASVTAPREASGDTLSCDDLTGWPKHSLAFFSTFRLKADGSIDTSSQSDWKGIVKDNTITQVTRLAGAEDSGHLVGDQVMQNGTIGYIDSLVEGLLKIHNPDGTLKNDMIQTSNIKDGAITSAKIANKTITGDNIADSTIKAQNIDFTTIKYSSNPKVVYYLNDKPVKRIYLELSLTNKITSNAYNMTGKTLVKLEGTLQYGDNNMAGNMPLNFKESSDYYFMGYVKGDHWLHLEYNDKSNTTSPRKCWLTIDYMDD